MNTQSEQSGTLVVITGPSGAGKDSVLEEAKRIGLESGQVITTTTRPMRTGEAEGKPYYFVTQEEFEQKIDKNEMLEWANVYGNYYGSTKEEVERVRTENDLVILKIDPQGARTIKEMMPDAVTVFVEPPSVDFLKQRLEKRATDSEEVIAKRLEVAKEEMDNISYWDHRLLNDEGKLTEAAENLIAIIRKAQGAA